MKGLNKMGIDFDITFDDIGNAPITEDLSLGSNLYEESMQLIQEAIDLKGALKKAGSALGRVKERALQLWRWICRTINYLRKVITRRKKSRRVEKAIKAAEKAHEENPSVNISFDNIPGDDYEGMFEAGMDELQVFDNVSLGDLKQFGKNLLTNKKMVMSVVKWAVPGVGAAEAAVNTAKLIAKMTPIVTDIIVTSKEIALLRKKYAGKTKKFKDDDGNMFFELPAESYVTIDKYVKCLQRAVEFLEQGGRKEKVTLKIASTDDLFKVGKMLLDSSNSLNKEHTSRYDQQWDAIFDKYEELINAADSDVDTLVKKRTAELEKLEKDTFDLSRNIDFLQAATTLGFDAVSRAASFYIDGEEYRINDKAIIDMISPYLTRIGKFVTEFSTDIETMNTTGMNCLQMFVESMKRFAPRTASLAADLAKSGLETTIKKKNNKDFLVKVQKESYIEEAGRRTASPKVRNGYLGRLPEDIRIKVMDIHKIINAAVSDLLDNPHYEDLKDSSWAMSCIDEFRKMPKDKSDIGAFQVSRKGKTYKCVIQVTGQFRNHQYGWIEELLHEFFCDMFQTVRPKVRKQFDVTITNDGHTGNPFEGYSVTLSNKVSKEVWDLLDDVKEKTAVKTEAANTTPQNYNSDMSDTEAKRTLRAVSQQLMNDFQKDKSKKMTQYTANIYANVITKNLLSKWAGGFSRFTITLDDYQSFHTVEFKVPKMTLDFVGRFIQGRETIDGFLHRQSEIKMKISPRVFHTMKNPDDAYNFFKAAITYYDKKLGPAGQKLMVEAMRLTPGMKHLISTTKLSGIVTYPMQLLFIFDDVNMSDKDTFTLSPEDVKTVSSFIRNIASHYAAPEKEKKKIIEDVQKMVKTLRESAAMDDNIAELYYLPEAVNDLFAGKFDQQMKDATERWYESNVDIEAMQNWNYELQYMREAFGVKKLKKIPLDTVAYIQIETEAIQDANDKMMISSYCLSKLEIVEWYIELLDVGSKKYIVPHNKPYLTSLRTQLLACFKKIMATPIPKSTNRPLIDINYPKGYEG